MNDRRARAGRLLWRLAILLLVAAVVTDRIALYAWGLSVIRLYRGFCVANSGSGLADMPGPMLGFGKEEGAGCHLDLLMYGSSVRPDDIRLGPLRHGGTDCTLRLTFLPPPLAWSTRLFPLGRWGRDKWPSTFYYAYEIRMARLGDCHLYRAVYPATDSPQLLEAESDSRWPHFYF
jgi:hypothetical protein